MDLSNVTSSIMLTTLVTVASPPKNNSPCHCSSFQECNVDLLTCAGGCQAGWSGPCCWRGEIFLNAADTQQSSTYDETAMIGSRFSQYSSDEAVDGKLPSVLNDVSFCAVSAPSYESWWYVWLDRSMEYVVEAVNISGFTGSLDSTAQSLTLTCHCLGKSPCSENGFCPDGCEPGWHGPGCQVGNLAFRKPTEQSSTLSDVTNPSSDKAVDGIYGLSSLLNNCIHTTEWHSEPAWWKVTLDRHKLFVILNITIANKLDDKNDSLLSDYRIMYSNSTVTDWRRWHLFSVQYGYPQDMIKTYMASHIAIGRAVAVRYFRIRKNPMVFCELFVIGYEHTPCPTGFTGPGCLLYSCDSSVCQHMANGRCDVYGGCIFTKCPTMSRLPPECWIPVVTSSNYHVLTSNSTYSPPNLKDWSECIREVPHSTASIIFNCHSLAARRVGVLISSNVPQLLILCEVSVFGYPKGDVKSICATSINSTKRCNCGLRERCDEVTGICTRWCQEGLSAPECQPCPAAEPTLTLSSWYQVGASSTITCQDPAAAGFNVSLRLDFGPTVKRQLKMHASVNLSTTYIVATFVPDKSWNGLTLTCLSILKNCPTRHTRASFNVYYIERVVERVSIYPKNYEIANINCEDSVTSNPEARFVVTISGMQRSEQGPRISVTRSELPPGTATTVVTCRAVNEMLLETIYVTFRISWPQSLVPPYIKWCVPWCIYILIGASGAIAIAMCFGYVVMCKRKYKNKATVNDQMDPEFINHEYVPNLDMPRQHPEDSAVNESRTSLSQQYTIPADYQNVEMKSSQSTYASTVSDYDHSFDNRNSISTSERRTQSLSSKSRRSAQITRTRKIRTKRKTSHKRRF